MTLEEKVRMQLNKVFTPTGEVKLCGRDECRKAIQLASEFYPGVNFGDVGLGLMNLQAFHDCFFSKKELKKQLLEVFTTQGVLLPIKKEECAKLIRLARFFYPDENFGREDLGCLRVDAFHKLFFSHVG